MLSRSDRLTGWHHDLPVAISTDSFCTSTQLRDRTNFAMHCYDLLLSRRYDCGQVAASGRLDFAPQLADRKGTVHGARQAFGNAGTLPNTFVVAVAAARRARSGAGGHTRRSGPEPAARRTEVSEEHVLVDDLAAGRRWTLASWIAYWPPCSPWSSHLWHKARCVVSSLTGDVLLYNSVAHPQGLDRTGSVVLDLREL